MLGLDMGLARIPFFDATVPGILAEAGVDAVYVPSTPFGGDLPMRPDRGVTNYYGVGGYRGPLSDARTSGLRFAGGVPRLRERADARRRWPRSSTACPTRATSTTRPGSSASPGTRAPAGTSTTCATTT